MALHFRRVFSCSWAYVDGLGGSINPGLGIKRRSSHPAVNGGLVNGYNRPACCCPLGVNSLSMTPPSDRGNRHANASLLAAIGQTFVKLAGSHKQLQLLATQTIGTRLYCSASPVKKYVLKKGIM